MLEGAPAENERERASGRTRAGRGPEEIQRSFGFGPEARARGCWAEDEQGCPLPSCGNHRQGSAGPRG